MIVKMKKLTLLCTRSAQERTLESLRSLGAVHLQHVTPPEGETLEKARQHFDYLRRALEVLPRRADAAPSGRPPHQAVDEIWKLIHHRQALAEKIELFELERRRCEPFGDFSPAAVRELAEQGITVKLGKAPVKEMPAVPGGVTRVELSRDRSTVYFALIARGPVDMDFEDVPLSSYSLGELSERTDALRRDLAETESALHAYAGDRGVIASVVQEAQDAVQYLEARAGMGAEKEVVYLRGFLPAERAEELRRLAAMHGWAAFLEEPSPEDRVPTLLRNPKWVEPIKAVMDMIGVMPGYHELDISALFLIFLSIFFAFLIGDAGYGLLFIGLTLFGKFKLRGNEAAKPGLNLLMIMSICTVAWGALTGTWFGIAPDSLPAPFQHLRWNYLTGSDETVAQRIMLICFVIGTVHLSIAHIWNFFRKINTWGCLADLGWLCSTATMFFAVCNMVLGHPFPSFMVYVLTAGIALIVLSLILEKSYFGLVTLVLDVIANFVDIISYVRLYAVGAASFAIASAFNEIMVSSLGSMGPFWGGLTAAVCIFIGHGLNILLGAMAILVHGIRLNTLEFSGHAGVRWAGVPFKPFARQAGTKEG